MKYKWTVRLEFKPQDFWFGVYWKKNGDAFLDIWWCIIPMLPLHFTRRITAIKF